MMTIDVNTVVPLVTVVSGVATVMSVFIALRVYRRQMNAQVFITYTQR